MVLFKAIRGLNNARHITKEMFRYRPKAFIVFQIRKFTRHYKIESMYVVLNDGFHADKHIVHSYKVKIPGLDPLWGTMYSIVAQEPRFFKLCLEEQRKLIKIKL